MGAARRPRLRSLIRPGRRIVADVAAGSRGLIVLVDLLGFTIVMPLLAPFAREYDLSGCRSGCCSRPTRCASSSPGRSSAG